MHIQAALDRYILQLRADGRSPHTQAQVRRQVGLLIRWLEAGGGPTDVARIDHEHLAQFLASATARKTQTGGPRKASSGNVLRTVVRQFFKYAHNAGYTTSYAARLVRLARCGKRPPRALSDAEVKRLLAAVDAGTGPMAARDAALIRLLLGTGLRLGSALALTTDDVDLDRGDLHISHAKNDQRIVLPISRQVARELRTYLRTIPAGRLFPGYKGRSLTTRQAGWRIREWASKSGLSGRATAHSFRHSHAIRLYEKTGDLLLVQRALGHRDVSSTMLYAAVSNERLRSALRG